MRGVGLGDAVKHPCPEKFQKGLGNSAATDKIWVYYSMIKRLSIARLSTCIRLLIRKDCEEFLGANFVVVHIE